MTAYVLVFLTDGSDVLLVEKKKGPEINIGKFNGIGGKIITGEKPEEAASRETEEETGLTVDSDGWEYLGLFNHAGSDIFMFTVEANDFDQDPHGSERFKSISGMNDVGEYMTWHSMESLLGNSDERAILAMNVPTMLAHLLYGSGTLDLSAS